MLSEPTDSSIVCAVIYFIIARGYAIFQNYGRVSSFHKCVHPCFDTIVCCKTSNKYKTFDYISCQPIGQTVVYSIKMEWFVLTFSKNCISVLWQIKIDSYSPS